MIRSILAVVAGYLAMGILVFALFSGAYLAMGADRAFKPQSFDPSTVWIVTSFGLGLLAAIGGGVTCASIARRQPPVTALAAAVVALGALMAMPTLSATPDPGPRTGDVPNLEAMTKARTPAWVAFANPLVGAVGVMLGGALLLRRDSSPGGR